MNAADTLPDVPPEEAAIASVKGGSAASSWESVSAEQLRDIVKRGFAGGDHFAGAAAELERRSIARTAVAHETSAELERRRRRILRLMMFTAFAAIAAVWIAITIRWLG